MQKEHKIARFVSMIMAGIAAISLCCHAVFAADMGTAFSYQGRLVRNGTPVTNSCSFTFGLFDAPTGGTQQGNSPQAALGVAVANGLFTVTLDFGGDAFDGDARWIEIGVFCSGDASATTLTPRVELTPVPHALALPGLRTPQTATTPNVIGGSSFNSVAPGVVAATIAGGGLNGIELDEVGDPVFVNKEHHIYDSSCTIGGGGSNEAGSNDANADNDRYATVAGGYSNHALSDYSNISGGSFNDVWGAFSTIGGGTENLVSGDYATIAGGWDNWAGAYNSTVGGGTENFAFGVESTIGGGVFNTAEGPESFVGGGDSNSARDAYSTVCGGIANVANALTSTVVGGSSNNANGGSSFIGGGTANTANGSLATVSGGNGNVVWGNYATIPGGYFCDAGGDYSFAAGRFAEVRAAYQVGGGDTDGDQGTFVWADSTNSNFTSTGPNQFLIRAAGGVGIGTNAPQAQLDVIGGVRASRFGVPSQSIEIISPGASGSSILSRSGESNKKNLSIMSVHNGAGAPAGELDVVFFTGSESAPVERLRIRESGQVGIANATPNVALDVVGSIEYTGTITDVSDERLKENIAPLSDAMNKITGLRGVYFNMKDTPDQRDVGLIAQDVQAVLPEAVRVVDSEQGYMGVSYSSVIPLLVEAIKEQNGRMREQYSTILEHQECLMTVQSENSELREVNRLLLERIDRIERQLENRIHALTGETR